VSILESSPGKYCRSSCHHESQPPSAAVPPALPRNRRLRATPPTSRRREKLPRAARQANRERDADAASGYYRQRAATIRTIRELLELAFLLGSRRTTSTRRRLADRLIQARRKQQQWPTRVGVKRSDQEVQGGPASIRHATPGRHRPSRRTLLTGWSAAGANDSKAPSTPSTSCRARNGPPLQDMHAA